ncbi:MAG: DUF424 domain-containing protein [Candidatus Syntropharchaeales archaeon]
MYLKTYEVGDERLVAVCDRSIIGRSLEDGEIFFQISEQFYKGEVASEEEVVTALAGATNINLVGERATKCAIDAGILDEEGIIRIAGVPHAQIFFI